MLWALCLGACDDAPSGPVISLGSGIERFVPVAPGRGLRVTEGIQGGYHIFGSVRAEGIEAWDAHVEFELWQGATQIGGARFIDDFRVHAGDLVFTGATVFLFATHPPEAIADRETRMTVVVTDRTGASGQAEMRFVPECCDRLP